MKSKTMRVTTYFFKRMLRQILYGLGVVLAIILFSWLLSNRDTEFFANFKIQFGALIGFFAMFVALTPYADFKLLIQNGVSRRTFWLGRTIALVVINLLGQVLDMILGFFKIGTPVAENSAAWQLYGRFFQSASLNWLIWAVLVLVGSTVTVLLASVVGSCFSLLTKRVRRYVFLALAAAFFLGIRLIAMVMTGDAVVHFAIWLRNIIYFLIGGTPNVGAGHFNPTVPFISLLVLCSAALVASYYVTQQFKIKNE